MKVFINIYLDLVNINIVLKVIKSNLIFIILVLREKS